MWELAVERVPKASQAQVPLAVTEVVRSWVVLLQTEKRLAERLPELPVSLRERLPVSVLELVTEAVQVLVARISDQVRSRF